MNPYYFCFVFTRGIQLFQHHLLKIQSFLYLTVLGGGLVAKLCSTHVTPQTVAHQAPLFTGFPRQTYWSGLPFPSPRDLLNPRIKPRSPELQAVSCIAGNLLHCRWILYWLNHQGSPSFVLASLLKYGDSYTCDLFVPLTVNTNTTLSWFWLLYSNTWNHIVCE